jgi:hypothetical protein
VCKVGGAGMKVRRSPGQDARALPDVAAAEKARAGEAERLDADILAVIQRGYENPPDEEEFDALAMRLFRHQWQYNHAAREWWLQSRALAVAGEGRADPGGRAAPVAERPTPASRVGGWRDVPPLPTAAWKQSRVAAFPAASGDVPAFVSSGTTSASRSRVFVEDLRLYDGAILAPFRRHCLTDRERLRLVFLSPPPSEAPRSSLSHMFAVLLDAFGTPGSTFVGDPAVGGVERLQSSLTDALGAREAVFLMGPAFAFVHAIEQLRVRGKEFDLPTGSRLFQTGGFKGRSRAVAPEALELAYREVFGISSRGVVHEYGMAELASQFYAEADFPYVGPPWVRWQVLDPLTLATVPPGEVGVLAIWDLANRSNCFALRTEDLAVQRDGGFELLGRTSGAEPRGCSLEADMAADPTVGAVG